MLNMTKGILLSLIFMSSTNTFAKKNVHDLQYQWTQEHYLLYEYAKKNKSFILKNGREKFKNYLHYKSHIRDITEQFNAPKELVIIAAIESSFVENARSRAGAVGMWQFMPDTARDMGLTVNNSIDERLDWQKSTIAAIKYMSWLAEELDGDYESAVLAYNYGIGRLKRSAERVNSNDAFALIDSGLLPKESEEYLLKFLTYLHYFDYLIEMHYETD
ncbi:SLT domain-containing protein [Vibrio chagasii]|nr:SLT domain-containing protein [Vibrio chagasii]